ncbi:LysR family transcriptional regulator [Pigmentiphaga litoralis]|uniref:LysR family transcriptional regulator n=1 Tax=Pigmentiphaga litoralis TaxID=516702 RepID=UPI003B428F31
MDLRQLECFVRVVELGSVTRAAITLNLSQPVVSRHVRQLEVELKEHLLSRNGRGLRLPMRASACWNAAGASCTRSSWPNRKSKSGARRPAAKWWWACRPVWARP